jgi:hypothetical protein
MVLTHKGGSMLYASKTRTIFVPVLHTERSKVDRVFVVVWRLLGGYFVQVRVGNDYASWMTPRWLKKRRVRVTANM